MKKQMPDYSKGKIYKIENDIDDEIYIGSTIQPLSVRWGGHKNDCKRFFNSSCRLYELMRLYGEEHFKIILVKSVKCENKEELKMYEAKYIREMGTLNIQIPGRTKKEYNNDNVEKFKVYHKQKYIKNKDEILEQRKMYREANKDKLLQQRKMYRETNKDKISNERKQKKYECDCGSVVRHSDKAIHLRTKKHQNFVNNQNNV